MYVPVVKKLLYKENLLVERTLPEEGYINVSVGDVVEPFNKLGTCKVNYEITDLGEKFKPHGGAQKMANYAKGMLVGSVGHTKFFAPYNGYLEKTTSGYIYKSEHQDYWLLPGVWGEVVDVSHNRSVLIKTQAVDVHVPITTEGNRAGELIVFPNPSDIMADQYFNNYLKSSRGKIVYVSNKISQESLQMAKELEVGVVLAGSADKETFDFAVANNIGLGLFSGFGEMATPNVIFDFINDISNRYVFFHASRSALQIPVPPHEDPDVSAEPANMLRFVKKGIHVQVLTSQNFGQMGVVDRVSGSSIFVKLDEKDEVVEVTPPNILAIE